MIKPISNLLFFSLFSIGIGHAQNGGFTGMGNASVGLYDFWALYNNQAGLANINNIEVGVSYDHNYQIWQTGIAAAGFVLPTQSGNFALMTNRYGYSGYAEHNNALSYARNLGEKFSASLTFNYLVFSQAEAPQSKGAFFFQTGFISKPIDKLQIGLHLYNPSMATLEDYNNKKVPTIVRFGLAYFFTSEVLCSIETEKDIDQKIRFKSGIQYMAINNFYLRTGFLTNPNQFSLGIGYNLNRFVTDIAITTHEILPLSSQISFKYIFAHN